MLDATAPARRRASNWGLPFGLVIAANAVAGFAWLIFRAQALPTGVVPIAWDKEACAHSRKPAVGCSGSSSSAWWAC